MHPHVRNFVLKRTKRHPQKLSRIQSWGKSNQTIKNRDGKTLSEINKRVYRTLSEQRKDLKARGLLVEGPNDPPSDDDVYVSNSHDKRFYIIQKLWNRELS